MLNQISEKITAEKTEEIHIIEVHLEDPNIDSFLYRDRQGCLHCVINTNEAP